ncbi:MAG: hypothetical protein HON65_16230 [Rhodospirillales bacterium]|jgi:hypothetical protein|nr:hypothetical protein [Rhodospirillales bacterium]
MQNTLTLDLVWWISMVELPALAGLFWINWRTRRDMEDAVSDGAHDSDTGLAFLRESLSAYKLEVAQSYVSMPYLKEVERRLTSHLVRIENKLGSGKGDAS